MTELGAPPIEGIDRDAVSGWLSRELSRFTAPFTFDLVAGGRSNLTYRVTDAAGRPFVVRRPPVSNVLPTAHDMGREFTVLSALGPTAVPVPETYALCEDATVTGAPFTVMEFVDGHILRDEEAALTVAEDVRRRAAHSLVDTLADLHEVDIDAVGLSGFGRREGYVARQLQRWHGQFSSSPMGDQPGPAVVDPVHELLSARIPEQQGVGIVHGDFRLDNTVVDDSGTVAAVLDWEISTIGDPLADLGLLLVYWTEPDDEANLLGVAPTRLPGFGDRAGLLARYAARSERDLSEIGFYRAFGLWKLACILQGVASRYAAGAAAGDRSGVDQLAPQVTRLGEMALEEVEAL